MGGAVGAVGDGKVDGAVCTIVVSGAKGRGHGGYELWAWYCMRSRSQ